MNLNVTRLLADDSGETHFERVELPCVVETLPEVADQRITLQEIPTTTLVASERLEKMPRTDRHAARQRQFVVCVRGEFEITTSTGDSKKFHPGDWLLVDDMGSKGHTMEEVGEERMMVIAIGIADTWKPPGS